jgi:hypothetical protein
VNGPIETIDEAARRLAASIPPLPPSAIEAVAAILASAVNR